MRKALLVTHVSGFVPQFEMNNVHILQNMGYEVHYASNFHNPSYGDDNSRLEGTGIICHQIDFERSPFKRKNITAYRQLKKLMEEHGWTKYFNVDIMDAEGNDLELDIQNGKVIKKNYVGRHIQNYDSMLVLSHFKGHPMGGYGGALKQLSIGCGSSEGKAWIHSAGVTKDQEKLWDNLPEQNKFLEAMADAASSVHNMFKGNIAYINVMCNMSVDCDCCAVAEDPCMKDVGILASTDPIAVDQACIDIIYNSKDPGRDHFVERVERQNGVHTIEAANELGFGSREYELINID